MKNTVLQSSWSVVVCLALLLLSVSPPRCFSHIATRCDKWAKNRQEPCKEQTQALYHLVESLCMSDGEFVTRTRAHVVGAEAEA